MGFFSVKIEMPQNPETFESTDQISKQERKYLRRKRKLKKLEEVKRDQKAEIDALGQSLASQSERMDDFSELDQMLKDIEAQIAENRLLLESQKNRKYCLSNV